jgi:hypothetical protein
MEAVGAVVVAAGGVALGMTLAIVDVPRGARGEGRVNLERGGGGVKDQL